MAGGYEYHPDPNSDPIGALRKELNAMKQEIAANRQARAGLGITIDPTTNTLVVSPGRGIKVTDTDGRTVAIIGALPSGYDRSDGSPQPGVVFYREDGTLAALLGDSNATTPPFKQSWQVFDRAGNVVLADDANSGKGLATPYIGGLVLGDTNTGRWPSTTSATFVDIAMGYFTVQNPRVQFDIQYVADAATTGQLKLLINGTQVDTTQTVTASFGLWTRYQVALPASATINSIATVELQALRSSGTGSVYAQLSRWEGDQTP